MAKEVVSYVDVSAPRTNAVSVMLAGWPTDQVNAIHTLLTGVVPVHSAADDSGRAWPNPFAERLSIARQPSDIDFVRRELSREGDSLLLVFIEDLASVLAREFAKEGDGDLGVAREWQVAVDRLLAMTEQGHSKTKVVCISDVGIYPNAFVDYLSDLLSWPLRFARPPEPHKRSKWDDFYLLVARQYVQEHRDLHHLDEELQARRSFVPLPEPGHSSRVDWSEVLQDVTSVRRENAVLLDMLHKVQLEFEQSMIQLAEKDEALTQKSQERDVLAKKLDESSESLLAARAKLDAQSSRAQRLDAKLYETKTARRATVDKLKSTSEKLNTTETELKKARLNEAALKSSTSWKLTSPMRRVVSWFKG